jgi:hypothetical protein
MVAPYDRVGLADQCAVVLSIPGHDQRWRFLSTSSARSACTVITNSARPWLRRCREQLRFELQRPTAQHLVTNGSSGCDEPDRQLARLPVMKLRSGDITLTIRTTRTTASCSSPFTLRAFRADEYVVVLGDELIEGLS